jgi:flagellin
MVVRTNTLALNSHRNLGLVGNNQARASSRLSSGFRINSGADDAAGLAISEGMRSQIRGMNQASRNAQDGISLIQTAEGYTATMTELMQRARELATQGANDTNSSVQRGHIANELTQIANEVNRIWMEGTFNGTAIFGHATELLGEAALNLQVGADGNGTVGSFNVTAAVGGGRLTAVHTAVGTVATTRTRFGGEATTHASFRTAMDNLETDINAMSALRAGLGAVQNRLEFTIENLDIASENLSASESRIRDADMAAEMMRLTQANVLQQAATSMLAQANQAPQSVLQLLG